MMNTDPTARLLNTEISRRGLLSIALLGGGTLAVAGACGLSNPGEGNYDHPVSDPPAVGLETGSPPPDTTKPLEPHEGLSKSTDPALQQLAAAERKLGYRFDANMLFVGMPRNKEEAEQQANDMAGTLREYAKQGIRPIVIMEPTHDGGATNPNLGTLAKDETEYAERWDTYFRTLNWKGITSEQMGTWVPFPEPNIPEWGGAVTNAATFKKNFIPLAQGLQAHFNDAEIAVLLNRTSCPDGDTAWAHATNDIKELEKYVTGIPQGLVKSFCLQGYPWEKGDRAVDFVQAEAATACAQRLGGPGEVNVWLNTGSFARRRMDDGSVFAPTTAQRAEALNGELEQARKIQAAGYSTSMVIFGQNKFGTPEGVDWSYTRKYDAAALEGMLQGARASNIPVSLFQAG